MGLARLLPQPGAGAGRGGGAGARGQERGVGAATTLLWQDIPGWGRERDFPKPDSKGVQMKSLLDCNFREFSKILPIQKILWSLLEIPLTAGADRS